MSYLKTSTLSHGQRVKALYKAGCRNIQSFYYFRHLYRYHAVMLRARFDDNKDIQDPVLAKKILEAGEEELFMKQHPQPFKFPLSPGGSSYGREVKLPDWYLDIWHPLERAQYPEYFAKREQRKMAFIEAWEKKYGKPENAP